jgi:hypothetical protein
VVSSESSIEFAKSRDHIRSLTDVLIRVRETAERITSAANSYAVEMHQLSKDLRYSACHGFAMMYMLLVELS